tara:strand:+ start:1248 stop:2528 length:1281 start_codon:yes stop_codon:yes gene_type:complete
MFKRGGSSFQAQGTGITSPFDTPRKNYKVGTTWEEIEERRTGLYQPRSEMSFAAEGFSALANPYKDDGSAKTIGEMLYEGASQVRKSRAADKAMGQSVELANIESEAARLALAEERAWKEEQAELDRTSRENIALSSNPLLKDKSITRQIEETMERIIKIASQNRGNPGSEFELSGYAQGIAQGLVTINNMQGGDELVTAMVVPSSAYKKVDGQWAFDVAQLAGGMVYWDPMTLKWFVVENAQTANAKEIYFDSYEQAKGGLTVKKSEENNSGTGTGDGDGSESQLSEIEIKNNEISMKIVTNLKDVDINDKSVIYDEAAKVGIKIVENPGGSKTWLKNLAENEMSLPAFKKILQQKKMKDSYAHVKGKRKGFGFNKTEDIQITEKMAGGGRAGYAEGTLEPDLDADELNELTAWWKSEVNNSFDS